MGNLISICRGLIRRRKDRGLGSKRASADDGAATNAAGASTNAAGASTTTTSGATMVEAAFVLPLFLLAVFLFIDFARFFLVYVVLSRAATQGVDRASKVAIEIETTSDACQDPATGPDCGRFRTRIQDEISCFGHL